MEQTTTPKKEPSEGGSTALPLWEDTVREPHLDCWNCGKRVPTGVTMLGSSFRYVCECGCGWSRRFNTTDEQERGQKELRETILAKTIKTELVDFTKPGAPSSPA